MLLKYASVVLTDAVTTLPLGFVIHYFPPCLSCRGLLDLSAATQPLVVKQADCLVLPITAEMSVLPQGKVKGRF